MTAQDSISVFFVRIVKQVTVMNLRRPGESTFSF